VLVRHGMAWCCYSNIISMVLIIVLLLAFVCSSYVVVVGSFRKCILVLCSWNQRLEHNPRVQCGHFNFFFWNACASKFVFLQRANVCFVVCQVRWLGWWKAVALSEMVWGGEGFPSSCVGPWWTQIRRFKVLTQKRWVRLQMFGTEKVQEMKNIVV
jgi:hypothetical protein